MKSRIILLAAALACATPTYGQNEGAVCNRSQSCAIGFCCNYEFADESGYGVCQPSDCTSCAEDCDNHLESRTADCDASHADDPVRHRTCLNAARYYYDQCLSRC